MVKGKKDLRLVLLDLKISNFRRTSMIRDLLINNELNKEISNF